MPLRLFIPGVVDTGIAAIALTTPVDRHGNGFTKVVDR